MSSVVELFAKSPRIMAAVASPQLFNTAISSGYNSDLVRTLDLAAKIGDVAILKNIGRMLSSPVISPSDLSSILFNANMPTTSRTTLYSYMEGPAVKATLDAANLTADQYQTELYNIIDIGGYDTVIGIITAGASDATITSSTTLTSGINRYRVLKVYQDVTLTLGADPGVIIADTIINFGTIASGWVKGAGGAPGKSGAGAGGGGCGAVIILTKSMRVMTITANGVAGGNGTTVGASGAGGAGAGGNFWLISGDSVPLGGNGGGGSYGGAGNPNGGGGGGYSGYGGYGGAGGTATTTIFTDSLNLLNRIFRAICDWWLVNVIGKTPTSTISIPSLGGSGGGGGGATDASDAGGGGGGGGGQIIIYGTSITAGTVQAKGGAGGNGGTEGSYDAGGGGGGGGIIYVFYKSLTGTFTYDVSGGAGGTGDYNGAAGGTGVFRAIAV
jgi:hypothetical protein